MKLLIASDYYEHGAINGVANRITSLHEELQKREVETFVVSNKINSPPSTLPRFLLSTLEPIPETIQLKNWYDKLDNLNPDVVWIMTEESVGLHVRWWCLQQQRPFQTLFTTKYPEFFDAGGSVGVVSYDFFRNFHKPAEKVHVPTASIKEELIQKQFLNRFVISPHGTDTKIFTPEQGLQNEKSNYVLHLGRLSPEKNIEALFQLDTHGMPLYVIGNGPLRRLVAEQSSITMLGIIPQGPQTAKWYANAAVTVFTSKLDTFGLVITESLACGTPVAAFDAPGPRDILTDTRAGVCANDLQEAFDATLQTGNREFCRNHVIDNFSVEISTDILLENLTCN